MTLNVNQTSQTRLTQLKIENSNVPYWICPKLKKKTTSILLEMEDDLNFLEVEDDLKFLKMEDDLNVLENGRQPQFLMGSGRQL